jgi:HSP20 family protein
MALIRWTDPFRELAAMQDRVNRLFEDYAARGRSREEEITSAAWAPPVDIYETNNEIVVKAELPGLTQEEINVEVKDGILTLRGERRAEKEVKEESYHRMECSYGAFARSFMLPTTVDEEKTKASLKNGILEIHLPKKEQAKPKQIKVAA